MALFVTTEQLSRIKGIGLLNGVEVVYYEFYTNATHDRDGVHESLPVISMVFS